jgi:hypothetical protein
MSRLLTVNVLEAFHASRPQSMPRLYEWRRGWLHVQLNTESYRFLKEHGAVLELVGNFYWAEFLEGCNRLAPRIIQKVTRDGATRRPLRTYLRILLAESAAECFYCGAHFDEATTATVDHVIPWSFLLEDDLWDLVLACTTCNSRKSDWLPNHDYLERLIIRNRQAFSARRLPISDEEIERLYQAAISVEWPRFWTA